MIYILTSATKLSDIAKNIMILVVLNAYKNTIFLTLNAINKLKSV